MRGEVLDHALSIPKSGGLTINRYVHVCVCSPVLFLDCETVTGEAKLMSSKTVQQNNHSTHQLQSANDEDRPCNQCA